MTRINGIVMRMSVVMTSADHPSPLVVARVVGVIVSEVPAGGVGVGSFVSPILPVGGSVQVLQSCPLLGRDGGSFGDK